MNIWQRNILIAALLVITTSWFCSGILITGSKDFASGAVRSNQPEQQCDLRYCLDWPRGCEAAKKLMDVPPAVEPRGESRSTQTAATPSEDQQATLIRIETDTFARRD